MWIIQWWIACGVWYENIGCELPSLVRSSSRCYINNHNLSPVRFIINSLSASISTLHYMERHLFTANSYIRTPIRPCAGYYSHGLYCGHLNEVRPHIFATCTYRNSVKAAYLFQLTLVCTSNLPLSLASMWCVAGPLNLHHLLGIVWIISLFYRCYYVPAYFHVLVTFNNLTNWLTKRRMCKCIVIRKRERHFLMISSWQFIIVYYIFYSLLYFFSVWPKSWIMTVWTCLYKAAAIKERKTERKGATKRELWWKREREKERKG